MKVEGWGGGHCVDVHTFVINNIPFLWIISFEVLQTSKFALNHVQQLPVKICKLNHLNGTQLPKPKKKKKTTRFYCQIYCFLLFVKMSRVLVRFSD